MSVILSRPLVVLGLALAWVANAAAAEPLAKQIDAAVVAKHSGKTAGQADDAEFVRRIYLDLAGRIPTVDEARKFLDDKAADKRS